MDSILSISKKCGEDERKKSGWAGDKPIFELGSFGERQQIEIEGGGSDGRCASCQAARTMITKNGGEWKKVNGSGSYEDLPCLKEKRNNSYKNIVDTFSKHRVALKTTSREKMSTKCKKCGVNLEIHARLLEINNVSTYNPALGLMCTQCKPADEKYWLRDR